MILTDDMLAVAFQYRDTELWAVLADSDVFAFRLSDGEVGYCCIMGNGGEHLALGFYRGRKGFSSYLKTINLSNMQLSDIEMFEMASTFDCINCDFMQASGMNDKTKKLIRSYAEVHGVKIRRPKGWPDFTRHLPFKVPFGITCEKDACDIVEALRAAIAVAGELTRQHPVKLGFDEKGEYPTMKGGKIVPYLTPNAEGAYDWGTIKLPALQPDEWITPKFENDILTSAMKKLSTSGIFQMKLIHLPVPMEGGENKDLILPAVLLGVNDKDGMLLPIFSLGDGEKAFMQMLVELACNLRQSDSKPGTIEVVDDRTESLLKDFCARCDIRLSRKKELPILDDACSFMISNFMR